MKHNYQELWNQFKENLIKSLEECPEAEIEKIRSISQRTSFYFEYLLPKVASKINLLFTTEEPFRVDGTFYRIGKQDGKNLKIPIILLESENDYSTSEGEVKKLCLLNAPLKILMIYSDWDGAFSNDIKEGFWEYIMEDFNTDSSLTGFFVFINCSWNKNLRFDAIVYDENVKCLGESALFVR